MQYAISYFCFPETQQLTALNAVVWMVHKHLPNFYSYVVLPCLSHQSRNLPHILYQTRYATLSTEWEKEFYSAIPVFQRIYVCFSLSLCMSEDIDITESLVFFFNYLFLSFSFFFSSNLQRYFILFFWLLGRYGTTWVSL